MDKKRILLKHLKAAEERVRDYALGLMAKLAGITTELIEALEENKADKPTSKTFVIPNDLWSLSSGSGKYTFYYDIYAEGVTTHDLVTIAIAPDSIDAAVECELCPTCETMNEYIRIRAKSIPSEAIQCEYWIVKGKVN